jgi:glycosyltransferase involved in cell wall biosynthesis
MYKGKKIAVVVPAYNEEDHVGDVIRGIPDYVDYVLVVDDCSTDRTGAVVRGFESSDPRVRYVRNEKNLGVGGAILHGHEEALKLGSDIDVVMAGDNQMDPTYIPKLLDPIIDQDYDYVKGNRFLRNGHLRGMPKQRVFGNYTLTFMTKAASGYWNIFDPQNGYTALKMSTFEYLDREHISRKYQFENDLLIHLSVISAKVKDVAIPSRYDTEVSKIKMHKFIPQTLGFLTGRFFWRFYQKYIKFDFHPIALLVLAGLPLFTFGLIYSGYVTFTRLFDPPVVSPTTGTIMIAILPLFLGFQMLLTGLMIDVNQSRLV